MYISLSTESAQQSMVELQWWVMGVFNWMTQTKLSNQTKQTQQILQSAMRVLFVNNLSQDISCSACFYHIWDIRRIGKGSPLALAEQIAVALVTSKLDYCNSLLHNIPKNYSICNIIWLR